MNSRPNILVIQAGQLAAKYLGAYRNPIASTPHIDSLAANGAVFDSAYDNGTDNIYSQWAYQDILGYRFPQK